MYLCVQSGTVHGGVIASLGDLLTTLSVEVATHFSSQNGTTLRGSSISLSVEYLRPISLNSPVTIESKIIKLGRQLAFLDCKFLTPEDEKLLAQVNHVKML